MKNIRDNKGIVRTWSDSSHTCIDFQMKKLPSCHLHQGMPLSKPSPDLYQGTPLSRPCPLLGWGPSSLRKRGLPASGVHLHLPPCLPHTHFPFPHACLVPGDVPVFVLARRVKSGRQLSLSLGRLSNKHQSSRTVEMN